MRADTDRALAGIAMMREWRHDGGLGKRDATLALDAAEALALLFAALDHVDPAWRADTLDQCEDGDEVNAAWDRCATALAAVAP